MLMINAYFSYLSERSSAISGVILGTTAALMLTFGLVTSAHADANQPTVSFKKQVYPIFEAHCLMCHSPSGVGEIASSLDLSSYKGLRQGSIHGVALVPHFADRSPMMRVLTSNWDSSNTEALRMPPLGPRLSPQDIKTIRDWINQGALDN